MMTWDGIMGHFPWVVASFPQQAEVPGDRETSGL